MKVRLVRLSSTHDNPRLDRVEGDCQDLPEVGRLFIMTAPPLDSDGPRRDIWTTTVQTIQWLPSNLRAVFTTKNSKYRLEIMD